MNDSIEDPASIEVRKKSVNSYQRVIAP